MTLISLQEIVPPRDNLLDALAIETLLGSLGIDSTFSLETAGDERGRHFLIRAEKNQIEYLKAQLQSAYDQIVFRDVPPEQDPARDDSKTVRVTAQLTLRRPVYLPLRTYRDGEFRESDPVRGILGAFMNFQANERALAQLVLRPAPPNWADAYQGSARQIEQTVGRKFHCPRMMSRCVSSPTKNRAREQERASNNSPARIANSICRVAMRSCSNTLHLIRAICQWGFTNGCTTSRRVRIFVKLYSSLGLNLYPYTNNPRSPSSSRIFRVTISTLIPISKSSSFTSVNIASTIGPSSSLIMPTEYGANSSNPAGAERKVVNEYNSPLPLKGNASNSVPRQFVQTCRGGKCFPLHFKQTLPIS